MADALDELLILAESAASDDFDLRVYLPHRAAEVAHTFLIAVDSHLPHLIVNLPILHVVRFWMSVCGTLRTPLIRSRSITIAQPVDRILKNLVVLLGRTFELHAYHDDRLRIHLTAEMYELIGAEAVLVVVHPHPVSPTLTVLLRANAPFPVVLRHVAAAGPSQTGGMQFLHGLQDVGAESAEAEARLRGHRRHVHLHRTVRHGYGEVAVETDLCYPTYRGPESAFSVERWPERKLVFLPVLADFAQRRERHKLAVGAAQSHLQLAIALGVDAANVVFTRDDVLRPLEDTCLGLACRDFLRIAHVDGIVFDEAILAAFAEGCPLLCDCWNLHVAGRTLKERLAVGSRQTDVAIGGLGIVHPERHEIPVCLLKSVIAHHLLAVPIDRCLAASALDAQLVPLLVLVHLRFGGWGRCQRCEHIHAPPGSSAEALRLAHFHLADGEVGGRALLLEGGPRRCLVGSFYLRLCGGKGAALVVRIVYAHIVGRAVGLVAEGETDIHQTAAPTAPCQFVRAPVQVHCQVEVAGADAVYLKRLFVTGRRMQYHVIIHEPSVEIAIARMDARILLRLERALLYQFLPHAVVGTEIDVLEELAVEHLVDDARGLTALHADHILTWTLCL